MEERNKTENLYIASLTCLFKAKKDGDKSAYDHHYIEAITLRMVLTVAFLFTEEQINNVLNSVREQVLGK